MLEKLWRRASRGDTKTTVIIICIVVAGGIFYLAKFGPIYNQRWEIEDKMEEIMRRYKVFGSEEALQQELQNYFDTNKIPINAFEACKFESLGENSEEVLGNPATMTCTYTVPVNLPKMPVYKVTAFKKVGKIPFDSN